MSARSRNGRTNAINADDSPDTSRDAPDVGEAGASVVELKEGTGGGRCCAATSSSLAIICAYVRRIIMAEWSR